MYIGRMRRNLTRELLEGATDGALKKARPDTSGVIFDTTDSGRELLSKGAGSGGGFDWSPVNESTGEYCRGYVRGA
jgi:hypothetical protein